MEKEGAIEPAHDDKVRHLLEHIEILRDRLRTLRPGSAEWKDMQGTLDDLVAESVQLADVSASADTNSYAHAHRPQEGPRAALALDEKRGGQGEGKGRGKGNPERTDRRPAPRRRFGERSVAATAGGTGRRFAPGDDAVPIVRADPRWLPAPNAGVRCSIASALPVWAMDGDAAGAGCAVFRGRDDWSETVVVVEGAADAPETERAGSRTRCAYRLRASAPDPRRSRVRAYAFGALSRAGSRRRDDRRGPVSGLLGPGVGARAGRQPAGGPFGPRVISSHSASHPFCFFVVFFSFFLGRKQTIRSNGRIRAD